MSSVFEQLRLDGRVAIVTGGSKGLGLEMAEAFAEAGARVVLVSRSEEDCQAALEGIESRYDSGGLAMAVDVRERDQVEAMVARTLAQLGRVDILVNNAGINIRKPVEEFSEEEWRAVLDTNLTGPFFCCQAVAGPMKEQRYGRVINMGSILSVVGLAERAAYDSSKGGIAQLTRTLALEWAPYDITVNAICPGPFMTELNKPVLNNPEAHQFFLDRVPLDRWGDPQEIKGAALLLASEAGSYITGSLLFVDGGWTAR